MKSKFMNCGGSRIYNDGPGKTGKNTGGNFTDGDWFNAKWTDIYHFKRDWFYKKWIHRYKFGQN